MFAVEGQSAHSLHQTHHLNRRRNLRSSGISRMKLDWHLAFYNHVS